MRRTLPSLFYLAGYLPPAGLLLLTAPEFARNLPLSNRDYDDAPFRHVGILLVILAIVLIGIPPDRLRLRHRSPATGGGIGPLGIWRAIRCIPGWKPGRERK